MNKKENSTNNQLQSYTQRLFKVGFGPNLWGIISEDSLDKYSNKVGMEYYGERTLFYIPEPEEQQL